MNHIRGLLAGLALTLAAPAFAQESAVPVGLADIPSATLEGLSAETVRVPAGTVVQVELTETLSSETSLPMQRFALRLVEPLVINGLEVAPAGATGTGEIIDAVPSGLGGRQGRLIVSARTLELGGQTVRIRGMQLAAAGTDRGNAALGVSVALGVAGFLVQGGEIEMPAGMQGTARIAVDVDLPAGIAAPEIAATPPPAAEAPLTGTASDNVESQE